MRTTALALCGVALATIAVRAVAAAAVVDAVAAAPAPAPDADAAAAAAALSASELAATVANCVGGGYDLSSIAGTQYAGTDGNTLRFLATLCGVVSEPSCSTNGGSVCQYTAQSVFTRTMAKWDSTGTWTSCSGSVCPNGGFTVSFANGDACGSNPWQSNFVFACTAGSSATNFMASFDKSNPCLANFVWSHQVGCQTPDPNNNGGGDGGGKGGLSGGSVFLIIFFVTLPVYVVAGCVWKRQRQGAAGMEACPNIDFWRQLPGLVGDGFKFTWRKCLGLCGKGDATYEGMS